MTPLDLSSLPDSPISRLAPTPSGFLHLGNAVNFLITWALVRKRGGRLHLRIDDMDGLRFRNEVLEDIFASLKWLGLDWDEGPQDAQSFYKRFSLQKRKEHYRSELKRLGKASGRVFACPCSRSAIKKVSQNGLYPGTCRRADRPFVPGETALRVEVPQGTHIWVGRESLSLDRELGDFVLWRKDDEPSYQLASLIEDEEAGVNLIVRGEDLAHSTAAQLYLADLFGFFSFFRCSFLHHGLILGEDGEKLSKSRGAYSLKEMREAGKEPLLALRAAALALGLDPQSVQCVEDLLT